MHRAKWPDGMSTVKTPLFRILFLLVVFKVGQGSKVLEFRLPEESLSWATFEQSESLLDADGGPPKSVCAFIRPSRHSRRAEILSYGAGNTFWHIGINDYTLTMESNYVANSYDVSLPLGNWRHLCSVDIDGYTKLYVDGEEESAVREDSNISTTNVTAFFRIGSAPSQPDSDSTISSFIGSVAQLQAWNVSLDSVQIKRISQCLEERGDLDDPAFLSLSQSSEWKISIELTIHMVSHSELCVSRSDMGVIAQKGNYEESKSQCELLKGELLHVENVNSGAPQLLNKRSNCVVDDLFVSWLMGNDSETYAVGDLCSVLLSNGTISKKPCLSELPCSLCAVSSFSKLKLYGDMGHFDRLYYLDLNADGHIAFQGVASSRITAEDHLWILNSDLHSRTWGTVVPGLPIGRKTWASGNEERTFTLTGCTHNEFACDNSACIPTEQRCNAVEECSDKSDEIQCKVLFDGDKRTPIMAEKITVDYSAYVYNIYDIEAEKPVLEFDLSIFLSWYDSRNVFGNLKDNHSNEFDCNSIWRPEFIFIDGYEMVVKSKTIEKMCTVDYMPTDVWKSLDDPYMTTKAKGELTLVTYFYESLVTSPCLFSFTRYPFDSQQCNFTLLFTNFGDVFEIADEPQEFEHYVKRGNLREYELIDVTVVPNDTDKQSIKVIVNLENFYGYHMTSSFAPTLIMLLITLSTFFFPLENFTDRVMVSLTSLLVMAALFTQTAQSSVKTPYLKLLDIWYSAIILLSAFVNVSMTAINVIYEREKKSDMWPVKISPTTFESVRSRRKCFSAKLVNWVTFAFTLLAAVLFCITYYFMAIGDIEM